MMHSQTVTQIRRQRGIERITCSNEGVIDRISRTAKANFRQKLIKRYITQMDPSVLSIHGYNQQEILQEIENFRVVRRGMIRDIIDIIFYKIAKFANAHLFLTRTYQWARQKYLS